MESLGKNPIKTAKWKMNEYTAICRLQRISSLTKKLTKYKNHPFGENTSINLWWNLTKYPVLNCKSVVFFVLWPWISANFHHSSIEYLTAAIIYISRYISNILNVDGTGMISPTALLMSLLPSILSKILSKVQCPVIWAEQPMIHSIPQVEDSHYGWDEVRIRIQ